MGMFKVSARERKRNIDDRIGAYLVGETNEDIKENQKMGGAAATPSYVLHNDSLKGERC